MRRAPVDRLTVTIAGSSCGVSPTAIASANSSVSSGGRPRAGLMTKIEIVSTRSDLGQEAGESSSARAEMLSVAGAPADRLRPGQAGSAFRSRRRRPRRGRCGRPSRGRRSSHGWRRRSRRRRRCPFRPGRPRPMSAASSIVSSDASSSRSIGRHDVADLQHTHVAADKFGSGDLQGLSVTYHRCAPTGTAHEARRASARCGTR